MGMYNTCIRIHSDIMGTVLSTSPSAPVPIAPSSPVSSASSSPVSSAFVVSKQESHHVKMHDGFLGIVPLLPNLYPLKSNL